MESPPAKEKTHLVVAFDVETTGRRLPVCPLGVHVGGAEPRGDALISVGWAGGRLGAKKDFPEFAAPPLRLDIDLQKPADVSWQDFWARRGWSEDTFADFWGGRLRTLDSMQTSTVSAAVAAHRLNAELAALEQEYDVTPIVDAVGFDDVFVSLLLAAQGFEGLDHTRTGRPRRILDAYSFRLGWALLGPGDAAAGHENGSPAARLAFARQRAAFASHYEHPHLADRDAKGILAAFFSTLVTPPGR